jgi:Tol biopolymer transport system component
MSLSTAVAVVLFATIIVSACGPEADRSSVEGTIPAEAGLLSTAGTDMPAQDSTPMVLRRVWGGHDANLWGDISPEGRHLVFIDGHGGLSVRELATGEVRQLTPEATWYDSWRVAEEAIISPDGTQIAYAWYVDSDPEYELRVVDWDGGEARVLLRDQSLGWFGLKAWSPDGRQILIHAVRKDENGALSLVSLADGSQRILQDLGHVWPRNADFSPDGRYVVYDLPEGENSNERDIYTIPVEGSQKTRVVRNPANDFVLGWAPGGDHILFASDRTGSLGAWLLPVEGGQATGDPRLIKSDLWRMVSIGFTADGSFCYGIDLDQRDVYVTTIDPESGNVVSPPTSIDGDDLGTYFRPRWSPDGQYLSYLYQEPAVNAWYTDRYYVEIRSVETGETRRLAPPPRVFSGGPWFPDGYHLLVGKGKLDVQTGEAERLELFRGMDIPEFLGFSPDGQALFYRKRGEAGTVIAQMDLEKGVETILYEEPFNSASLSPGARNLALAKIDETGFRILTMPVGGGEPRSLLTMGPNEAPEALWGMTWSPDEQYLYYMTLYRDTPHQLWRLSIDGGLPQQILELDPALNIPVHLDFHPDGTRLAFDAQRSGAEVWLMEHFLPPGGDGSP